VLGERVDQAVEVLDSHLHRPQVPPVSVKLPLCIMSSTAPASHKTSGTDPQLHVCRDDTPGAEHPVQWQEANGIGQSRRMLTQQCSLIRLPPPAGTPSASYCSPMGVTSSVKN
jgi:hypothetical protein